MGKAVSGVETARPFPLSAEQVGKQGNEHRADQCHTASGHQLLHTRRLGTGVIVAVTCYDQRLP